MALPTGVSAIVSAALSLILFAGMQAFKSHLAASKMMTILGGFLGSCMFILLLTALNNFQNAAFGKGFQAKLFPEVLVTLFIAMFASGIIHRVCVTVCFLFSMVAIYYVNKLSVARYALQATPAAPTTKRGKGKK